MRQPPSQSIRHGEEIMIDRRTMLRHGLLFFSFLLFFIGAYILSGCNSKESYKRELERRGIAYSVESFHNIVGAGYGEMTELFLKAGMNINARGPNGDTALMVAAVTGNIEMLKFLIQKGADVNARNNEGYTALMYIASIGNIEVLEFLIKNKADINARNNDGETALMLAALNDQVGSVKFLIEKGADIHSKNNDGDTAMEYGFLNAQIADLLRQAAMDK
jgi:ankyrin repeat protein